jgi:type VI protein secretion system component VasK
MGLSPQPPIGSISPVHSSGYTLTPVPSEGIQNLGLSLDGQVLSYSGGAAAPKQFTWQGNSSHEAKASVRFGSGPDLVWSTSQGPWAIFHFFDKADHWQPAASGYSLEWIIRVGKDPVTLPGGKLLTLHLDLSTGDLPQILQNGFLSRLACAASVAQ